MFSESLMRRYGLEPDPELSSLPWWRGGRDHHRGVIRTRNDSNGIGAWRVEVSHYWNRIRVERFQAEYVEPNPIHYSGLSGTHGPRAPVGGTGPRWQIYLEIGLRPMFGRQIPTGIPQMGVGEALQLEQQALREWIEHIEVEHPLPAPDPTCGQVWVFFASDGISIKGERTVIDVWKGTACFRGGARGLAWPPEEAALISGYGAPWAPPPAKDEV